MNNLSKIITAKIVITILFWCAPLLLATDGVLCWLRIPFPREMLVFLRLLGWAYVALIVGYVFGLRATQRGKYPKGTVWMGIVSNGGAFVMLLIAAIQGIWSTWKWVAQAGMWLSLAATSVITVGLILFGPCGNKKIPE